MSTLNDYQLELGVVVEVLVTPFISHPFATGDDSEVDDDDDDDDVKRADQLVSVTGLLGKHICRTSS